jgi:choice-of-anchor B domain-containing protein
MIFSVKKHTIRLLLALLLPGCAFSQNFNLQFRSKLSFPGQTGANICGYAQGGREYALFGASKGMIVVDVTDPDNPQQIVQIPNVDDLWKEIKVYKHYAYVTTEGGGGLQIVDLSPLPSASLPHHNYTGDGTIAGLLDNIHALHVDTAKGFVYLYGANIFTPTGNIISGALALDLNTDPYNPLYAGAYTSGGYVHDGYVNNDTLFASHIYSGKMTMVNMANKNNPVVLGTVTTPHSFTHNTWLTDDHKTVLTTDEVDGSFLTAYDVSDPTDIRELDRIQATPGSGSVVHNTHILNDFAVTSWYKDGVSIVDAHRPGNLVQVGLYDTYPTGTGGGFEGCWGVYPFLPSGTIVASNISAIGNSSLPGELYVLTPTYVRACYLEGTVTDAATGAAIFGASVEIEQSPDNNTGVNTAANGKYATGQVTPGAFSVKFSKAGYQSKTVTATLVNGQLTLLDVQLSKTSSAIHEFLPENEGAVTVHPSPFSGTATVEYTLRERQTSARITMTDLSGNTVWSLPLEAASGVAETPGQLPPGVYFLTLQVEGRQTRALKVLKL